MEDFVKIHTEVKHGGMVWVTLDPNPTQSVDEWTAGAFDCIADAIDTGRNGSVSLSQSCHRY